MCTRRRVIRAWLCTALVLAITSFHFFVTVTYPYVRSDLDQETITTLDVDPLPFCYVQPAYDRFFVSVWCWIDFTLLAFVPFVVVLTGNLVSVTCIVRAVRFRRRQSSHLADVGGPRSGGGATDKGKVVKSSTLMLMTVSVAFLLTTSPNVIDFLKIDDWLEEVNDARSEARLHLAFTATNLLYYANNVTNFFLYCLAGLRFRRAMCQVFSSAAEDRRVVLGNLQAESKRGEIRWRRATDYGLRRTTEAPLRGIDSFIPAAGVEQTTLSTNVMMCTSTY